jgi:hypothetical protein
MPAIDDDRKVKLQCSLTEILHFKKFHNFEHG